MSGGNGPSSVPRPVIDETAQPDWLRTGYKFFPYAAAQDGHWWVLRLNYGFPEHDMYTLFVDGRSTVDITGSPDHSSALVRSIASLRPYDESTVAEPSLDASTAAEVVQTVARYADYGSEHGEPCLFCSEDRDGMARI
ncbi:MULTISPECIES: hypothetical protein [Mycobacterium]|uniref:Uncharacterized protein n=1 Tax=Mycobacterium colombiense TaxID=339268 RepID=A0A329L457_9MYCO|nr:MULTISPECIES: hypothetical protein [Mycobacterium]MDM4142593.1 hypothetical protein [Mycobacterium sp. FLAC0960]RAV02879.1 hypothetical protein DQP57_25705 [Mycobacterium colombiense]